MIVDESMMIGSEKLLLTLGVKATKNQDLSVGHQDVEVPGIRVKLSWNSRSVTEDLQKSMQKMEEAPLCIISDNCSSLFKGIRDTGLPHIRDVGHTLGMFLERIYKYDPVFTAYMKAVSGVRFQHIMNLIACPKPLNMLDYFKVLDSLPAGAIHIHLAPLIEAMQGRLGGHVQVLDRVFN